MHRLLNPLGFAVGRLAVFRGGPSRLAVKRRYLDHNGRASNAEKQPTGRGPEGCVENGSAASLFLSHVSIHSTRCRLLMASHPTQMGGYTWHGPRVEVRRMS